MTAPRHPGDKPPTNAAAKGVGIIALAVVIGAIFLGMGFSSDDGLFAGSSNEPGQTDTTASTAAGNDGGEQGTNNDTGVETGTPNTETGEPIANGDPQARPNNEIHYVVLNGSGAGGRAGRVSSQLSALGFVPSDPSNVPGGQVDDSHIYYEEGWQAEAQVIAKALGVTDELLSPLPAPFSFDMGDAHIMVVLGKDGVIKA